jgi:uncharacterized peroxidase-related enzyme
MSTIGFLHTPEVSAEAEQLFDDDVAEHGYVMNASRVWAYQPATNAALFALMQRTTVPGTLTLRERGVLIAACASALGDSYCSLAWGRRLAAAADARTAEGVLRGDDAGLTPVERALAAWARKVARNPNRTTGADVQELRDAGLTDARIFAVTVYVALRLAFATVNDALGVRPDAELRDTAPPAVLDAVTFGRSIADET